MKAPDKVTATNSEEYFAIGPKFVNDVMIGEFSDTVFFLGGCSTAKNSSLAKSLINRGASFVVGWDGTTSSGDNDRYMLKNLKEILVNEMKISESVDKVNKEYALSDHIYNGKIGYFSQESI